MLLGAHVSIAGGVHNAPQNGVDIGCEAIQIFSKNQRQWASKPYTQEQVDGFRAGTKKAGYKQMVVHDSYLINLGAPEGDVYKRSVVGFADEMHRCKQLGIPYLNFHPGAHVGAGEDAGIQRIVMTLQVLLSHQEDNPTMLLVENTAGQGTNVGYTFEQVGRILDGVDDERMGVCVDTQHSYAAGYDLATEEGYEKAFEEFDAAVGLKRLKAFHLNDSKMKIGARVDRHENIGDGELGIPLFERLVNDKRFKGIPGILETPGGPEGWLKELALLKGLRKKGAPDA